MVAFDFRPCSSFPFPTYIYVSISGVFFPRQRLVKGPLYAENSVSPCSLLTLQGIYIQQICSKKEKKKRNIADACFLLLMQGFFTTK